MTSRFWGGSSNAGLGEAHGYRPAVLTAPGYLSSAVAPYAAYGAQRIVSGYTGALYRIRRSDATEMDVSCQPGGDYPDYAAMIAWAGGSALTVTTIYDQSGNARHLTQSTVANQPAIVPTVRSGSVCPISIDGISSAAGASGTPYKSLSSTISAAGNTMTAFAVSQPQVAQQTRATFCMATAGTTNAYASSGGLLWKGQIGTGPQGVSVSPALTRCNYQSHGVRFNTTLARVYYPGGSHDSGAGTNPTATYDTLTLGRYTTGSPSNFDRSRFVCMAFYDTALSDANAATVQTSMDTLAGLTYTYDYRLTVAGDSITEGIGDIKGLNTINQMAFSQRPELFNIGVAGETMATFYTNRVARLGNLGTISYGAGKALFVIRYGSNDIIASTTGSALYTTLTNLVTYIKTLTGAKVGVQTLLPRTGFSGAQETERQNYNALVLANTAGADAVQDMAGDTRLQTASDTNVYIDGTHPTVLGHGYAASNVATLVASLLGATP